MKNFLILTTLLTFSTSNYASIQWLKTPFWTAPIENHHKLNIDVTDHFDSDCRRFKRTIYRANGEVRGLLRAESVDINRNLPASNAPFNVTQFYAEFDLSSQLEFGNHLIETNAEYSGTAKNLPFYVQNKSYSGAVISLIEKLVPIVKNHEESLTHVSNTLGLSTEKIEIVENHQGVILRVFGRDLVCDLIAGHISIAAEAPGYVELDQNQYELMERFYAFELSPALDKTLKSEKSSIQKAALLGFRMGQILEENFNKSSDQRESQILELMNTLLDSHSLKPNQNLQEVGSDLMVILEGNAGLDIVSVEFSTKQGE